MKDPRLVDYIKKNMSEGHTAKEITTALIKSGQPKEDVYEALDIVTEVKKPNKRLATWGIIISIIVLLVSLGFFLYFWFWYRV